MNKKSRSRVQRYPFAGVLTVIPLWITWIVLSILFRQLSPLGGPWVRALAGTDGPDQILFERTSA